MKQQDFDLELESGPVCPACKRPLAKKLFFGNNVIENGPFPEDLVELWNVNAHSALPRVKIITELRRRTIKRRLKQYPDSSFWIDIITRVNNSKLLTGQVRSSGHEGWRCSFDWIIKESNLAKVVEGVYDGKK